MSENPLLKKYRFVKLTEKAARIPRDNKIQLLEFYVSYQKSAEIARNDFINDFSQRELPKEYIKAISKLSAFHNAILALGYEIEEREDGGQHDKQKNKENK